jgi:hypothetical protein
MVMTSMMMNMIMMIRMCLILMVVTMGNDDNTVYVKVLIKIRTAMPVFTE